MNSFLKPHSICCCPIQINRVRISRLFHMFGTDRYSRQILFEGIGAEGQQRLACAHITVIGCGALGSSIIETLARAGVGRMRVIDRDFVEYSNLQRQQLYDERDARACLPKASAARRRVSRINSQVKVEAVVEDVNAFNIERLISDTDLVLDGTDNFETRFLINDACVKLAKPWIYGAAVSSYGLTMTVLPGMTACLRCIFENLPSPGSAPTCDTAGVILPIISIVSAIQSTEALKILSGQHHLLHKGLLQIDIWKGTYKKLNIEGFRERNQCKCCQDRVFEYLQCTGQELTTTLCGRNSVQIVPRTKVKLDLKELSKRLQPVGEVQVNKFLLRFKSAEGELTVFPDARSIIHGTKDESVARSLYARFIGV